MSGNILFFILFIIPFIVVPFGNSQFEIPKVVISEISIFVLFLLEFFNSKKHFFKSLNQVQIILLTSIFTLSLFHLLAHPTHLAFFGNAFRGQGILLLWSLLLFSFISSFVKLPEIPKYTYVFLLTFIFIFSLFIGNISGRAVATLGEPNALAAFIVFLWPFIFFTNYRSKTFKKYLQLIVLLIAFIIILLTFSQSGLVAFGIEILFCVLVFKSKISLDKSILIIFACIVLSYTFPVFSNNLYENRIDVWKTGVTAGFNNPMIGAGFGNQEIQIRNTSITIHDKLIGYYVDSGHNIFIDWFIQGGIVGVLLLIMTLILTVKNFVTKKNYRELSIFFGLIVMLSFNPPSVVSLIGFWWLVGRSFAN